MYDYISIYLYDFYFEYYWCEFSYFSLFYYLLHISIIICISTGISVDMSIIVMVIISTTDDISNLEVCTCETYQAKRVRFSKM